MNNSMPASSLIFNPYEGCILVDALGPILTQSQATVRLARAPRVPRGMGDIPREIAMHMLYELKDFHFPDIEEIRLQQTLDLMIRQCYKNNDPSHPATWAALQGGPPCHSPIPRAFAAAVAGHSGTGKSDAIQGCLRLFPGQIIPHETFPHLVGPHYQVTYQSIDVPAGGKSAELGASLMQDWDHRTGGRRFESTLAQKTYKGAKMLREWQQVANAHFLGILHLDEIQNLFKIPSLEMRRKGKAVHEIPELRVVDDESLKWLLTFINSGRTALLVSGTPDGMAAITKRFSNTQRFATSGYHAFTRFEDPEGADFINFTTALSVYQYVKKPLVVDPNVRNRIIQLTGGIRRIIIALWVCGQRVALMKKSGEFLIGDLNHAAATFLAPVGPAVEALLSGAPDRMARYEDLLPRDQQYWGNLWRNP